MKTRKQLILDFMLALAPACGEIHGEECADWSESFGRTDDGMNEDCPTAADSVFKLAAEFADIYLENVR